MAGKGQIRALCVLLAAALLVALLPMGTRAEEEIGKVVRVGYVNALNYEEGGEGEYKRGAGYEYLQKISYITGWEYEYVYGSFSECMELLSKGDIDLFGNVSYTEDRAQRMFFSSYPQGKDTYWLYTGKHHPELAQADFQRLNGCRIGVTGGSFQEGLLAKWLEDNHIRAQIVECKGYEELMGGLEEDRVEAIAAPDLSVNYDCIAITSIGSSDYYFAVSRQREDLLLELNQALYEIQNTETDYNTRLYARYYYKTASGLAFNEEEKQWLEDHGNTLRIGYLTDDLPFSGQENGQLSGVLETVIETLERAYGITIETVAYPDLEQMTVALKQGLVDAAGPYLRDFYLAEQENLVLTDAILDTTPVVVYKGSDYEQCVNTIAVTYASLFGIDLVGVLFPEAKLLQYDTQEQCFEAVAAGEAGSTVISSARIGILSTSPLKEQLSVAEMAKRLDVGMLTTKVNRRAATILNKGIEQSSDVLSGLVLSQHTVVERKMSFRELLASYIWAFLGAAALIILVLGVLLQRLVSSRRKLVEALKDARDANSANVAKTTFLNSMSHDIRTPMNAIIGFTNLALKQEGDPETKGCLEKIRQSSEYLMSLINDVLDISRIESGKLEYHPVPVDITAVMDTVLAVAKGYMENRDLEFVVSRQPLKEPVVLADELRIREVLLNILSNAVKFTKDGGKITFASDYRPGKDKNHIVVRYRISDTGVGMSPEFKDKVFEEFTQENAGARTNYKGTGLGMSITKRYVELMGGTISLDTQKGVGSTFTVELPLERTAAACPAEARPAPKRDLRGVRVLLAEDNDLNAEIATLLLEEQGMEVTRASDGKEAVRFFAQAPAGTFDVILMDVMMPEMNGYEATKAIRTMKNRPDGAGIPILAMTANAFAEDIQASKDAGMNDHLAKPIDTEKLLQAIAGCLRKQERENTL